MKGWRTIAFNAAAIMLPVTDAAMQFLGLAEEVLPVEWYLPYAILITAANMWLRTITTTSIGRKE